MTGHIRKRGKKSWAIVLDLGRDENGKRKQKWHNVRGAKADAEAELSRLLFVKCLQKPPVVDLFDNKNRT